MPPLLILPSWWARPSIQEIYGVQAKPEGLGGQTVVTFFRRKGLSATVWQRMLQMPHAPDERIDIDNLVGEAKIFAKMIL